MRHLKTVFDTLRVERLFVNLDKSEFGRDRLVFLGNVISVDGVSMDPEKIRAIRE